MFLLLTDCTDYTDFLLLDSSVMICGICGTFHADVLISHGFHGLHRFFSYDFLLLDSSVRSVESV